MTALMFAVKVGSFDVVKQLAEKSTELFAMNSVSMIHRAQILTNRLSRNNVYCRGMKFCSRWQKIVHKKLRNIY